MTTFTVELPEKLVTELKERNVSNDIVQRFIIRSLELWLRVSYRFDAPAKTDDADDLLARPFSVDATPFVDQLLDENLDLFEELAQH